MNRFFFSLVVLLATLNPAQAQNASTMERAQQICAARVTLTGDKAVDEFNLAQCMMANMVDQHDAQIQEQQQAIETLDDDVAYQAARTDQLVVRVDAADDRMDEFDARLAALQATLADDGAQPGAPAPAPVPVASYQTPQPQAVAPTAMVSVNPQGVLMPSPPRDLMSAYPLYSAQFPNTLAISDLNQSSSKNRCGSQSDQSRYVLVTNHGVPQRVITSSDRAANSGFVPAYLDTDQDGDHDIEIKVMDTTKNSTIYTTWREGDDIRLHYLVVVGTIARVNPQTGDVDYVPVLRYREATSSDQTRLGTVACGRDELSSPGGDRDIRAYDMVRVRGRIR